MKHMAVYGLSVLNSRTFNKVFLVFFHETIFPSKALLHYSAKKHTEPTIPLFALIKGLRNVSFRNSVRWPFFNINSIHKTKLSVFSVVMYNVDYLNCLFQKHLIQTILGFLDYLFSLDEEYHEQQLT